MPWPLEHNNRFSYDSEKKAMNFKDIFQYQA